MPDFDMRYDDWRQHKNGAGGDFDRMPPARDRVGRVANRADHIDHRAAPVHRYPIDVAVPIIIYPAIRADLRLDHFDGDRAALMLKCRASWIEF